MKFIAQRPTERDVEMNVLTDGQDTCTYAAMPDVLASLRSAFRRRGIDPGVCLAFECDNSVPSALILLLLLEEGYDFLLIPKRKQGCSAVPIDLPSFCGYRVAANREHSAEIKESVSFDLVPNPAYREGESPGGQRLYVRTSGSTGNAKLVVHSHRRLRQNGLNIVERYRLQSTDRVAIPVPLSHMYGLGAAFLPAVAVAASIDLQDGANVIGYIARERDFRPNRVYLTPTFCESLLKARKNSRAYDLTVVSGDRLRGDTFESYEARYGLVVQQYGSTEMGAIAATSPDAPAEARAMTVGKPLADVEVFVGDAPAIQGCVAGGPAETTDSGELWCRHPYGFDGYADESGSPGTGSQAAADDWFRMHDVARIRPDGRIQVLGRADQAVNRSGLLVLFADLEASIMTIPGVDKAVVVASGESDYGRGMAAFCVPAGGATVSASEIRAACLDRMPRREVPDSIIVARDLPLLWNGKVDCQTLVRMADAGAEATDQRKPNFSGEPC